ncbi:MAG: Jag N-terminal domain-containing protein [Firmicutes bacterium]|nr:Jag N-terminal domain-containing protein [Bacillota bacterium]
METIVEREGNTVEEAIEAALAELGVDRESVEIEVIEDKGKGFFGRITNGRAKVRVSIKESSSVAMAVNLVEEIIKYMNIDDGKVELTESDSTIKLDISGSGLGVLIGKRGETLSAVQTIVNTALKKAGLDKKLVIDVEGYRERRADTVKDTALRAADKAIRTGRSVLLKPMNSFDRRMVHVTLQDNNKVYTTSEGEEPRRQVRIIPKG